MKEGNSQNLESFREDLKKLIKEHGEGLYALYMNGILVNVYKDRIDALREGYKISIDSIFLVKEILLKEKVFHVYTPFLVEK
jgi:hypothetical protein